MKKLLSIVLSVVLRRACWLAVVQAALAAQALPVRVRRLQALRQRTMGRRKSFALRGGAARRVRI